MKKANMNKYNRGQEPHVSCYFHTRRADMQKKKHQGRYNDNHTCMGSSVAKDLAFVFMAEPVTRGQWRIPSISKYPKSQFEI